MSCQSLSLAPSEPQPLTTYHRAVHFSTDGESKSLENKMDSPRDLEMDNKDRGISSWGGSDKMTRSAPATCGDVSNGSQGASEGARFPKLEDCAHFHYGRVQLGGLTVKALMETQPPHNSDEDVGWITLNVHPHSEDRESKGYPDKHKNVGDVISSEEDSNSSQWIITRSAENFKMLDSMLHRCIYDRKVSGLPDLSVGINQARSRGIEAYVSLIRDYLHHFSIIADDSINCGPILNWFQMDNKGHRLLVASEDTNSINTPAVAAAYSVRRYVSQARDEISFEVGDMISVIDMPGLSESTWWRGKRGFKVGFFPQNCVAVIGDKVPRNMKEPPPIVGSVAVTSIKPVLRKHGKLISLFRSFILSRPSRRSLRQQGILKERVFGCDLGEHLLNSGYEVPVVLSCCAKIIEKYGCVDGIYRLSGASSTTQRLRIDFDEERPPPVNEAPPDVHAVASLLKMYFRELPNPLCTYQLYNCFVNAVQGICPRTSFSDGEERAEEEELQPRRLDDAEKLLRMRETVVKLPPPHFRTLAFLMRHLHHMSLLGSSTGMTARNMAIVWAPNLLRSPIKQHALQGVAVQAVVTEFLICYAELIFSDDQSQLLCQTNVPTICSSLDQPDSLTSCHELSDGQSIRRPKSLPLQTPTKLLSLEEARSKQLLRPSASREPQYIEVGGGPNSLPRYHTIIQLPSGSAKRGLKRSPSGWRGLFFRASKHRPRPNTNSGGPVAASSVPTHVPTVDVTSPTGAVVDDIVNCKDANSAMVVEDSRTARSCESLLSDGDSLPPLCVQPDKLSVNHHNRSVSCDSYFEASLAEMAGMRLRLSSQEREMDIFSEDDTTKQVWDKDTVSSGDTSVEPSPTKLPRTNLCKVASPVVDNRKRTKLEDQLSDLLYIDCNTPEHKIKVAESGSTNYVSSENDGDAKRICKEATSDVNSEGSSATNCQQSTVKIKLRDRGSPRKTSKNNISRHSHCGTPPSPKVCLLPQRHSTFIKVDWPHSDAMQSSTPNCYGYTQLQSDSECSLPVGESQDSLAKRLIESKESLISRSNMADSPNILHIDNSFQINQISTCINENRSNMEASDSANSFIKMNCDSAIMEKEDKEVVLENRNSGLSNVDWSDGLMDSSMDRSTISSDFEKSVDGKQYNTGKFSDFEGSEMLRKSVISSCEEANEGATNDKLINNRCNITLTPSEEYRSNVMVDSLEESLSPTNISYQCLNRSSNLSNDSIQTGTSKESTPTVSPIKDQERTDEIYECFSFARPSYIHLASSSGDSNTPGSPPQNKSPIRSTISITYKSPTKDECSLLEFLSDNESLPNEMCEKVQTIAETATVPQNYDANLPTQEAFQPVKNNEDLILLDTPVKDVDIYNQVKFFRQSVNEVNSLLLESDIGQSDRHESDDHKISNNGLWYENISFNGSDNSKSKPSSHHAYENLVIPNATTDHNTPIKGNSCPVSSVFTNKSSHRSKNDDPRKNTYENYHVPSSIQKECVTEKKENVGMTKMCQFDDLNKENSADNGNSVPQSDKTSKKSTTNVRQLANKFESPTENMGPFSFEKYSKFSVSLSEKTPGADRNKAISLCEAKNSPVSKVSSPAFTPYSNKLVTKYSNARSLDENAFIKEFGKQTVSLDKEEDMSKEFTNWKSFEAANSKISRQPKIPDLNLNLQNSSSNKVNLPSSFYDYTKDENTKESEIDQCPSITPTTENKIILVQARLSPKKYQRQKQANLSENIRDISGPLSASEMSLDQDSDRNKLSRERIEKYKEERRLFLREKYSPHSFRGIGDLQLSSKTNSKCKNDDYEDVSFEGVELRNPEKILERRNTADAVQRIKYSSVITTNRHLNSGANIGNVSDMSSIKVESPKVTHMQKKNTSDSNMTFVPLHNISKTNTCSHYDSSEANGDQGASSNFTKPTNLDLNTASDPYNDPDPRREKISPSFNIRDMAAKFERRSNPSN